MKNDIGEELADLNLGDAVSFHNQCVYSYSYCTIIMPPELLTGSKGTKQQW